MGRIQNSEFRIRNKRRESSLGFWRFFAPLRMTPHLSPPLAKGRLGGVLFLMFIFHYVYGQTSTKDDIRDIRGPIHIPFAWLWLIYIVAGITILILGIWLYRFLKNRKKFEKVKLPHEIAFEKLTLAESLMVPEKAREFSILVSDAVRCYIEARFNERAAHRTTEEFLYTLLSNRNSPLIPFSDSLQDFLNHCDLAKFAKSMLSVPQMQSMLNSARTLVEQTKSSNEINNNNPKTPPPLPKMEVKSEAPAIKIH
jgi:hypothetical protein